MGRLLDMSAMELEVYGASKRRGVYVSTERAPCREVSADAEEN
jgi:hypothetical protein